MAKHDFESDTMTAHDIMHCTRVYRVGDRFDRVRVVTSSHVGSFGFQDFWFSKARPTGAHRLEALRDTLESTWAGWVDNALREFLPARTAADFRRQYA